MKKSLLFTLLFVGLTASAQYTLIPDESFEWELIFSGIDNGSPDGKVLTSNINTLTSLVLQPNGIKDLTGIEGFTALTSLVCNNNLLTTLDLSKNTALTFLNCDVNQLTALNVTKNTALTDLSCTNNKLTALDVTQNTVLTSLSCAGNQLATLDVTKNTALISFECIYNNLTALDVTKNTALTSLDCTGNQLTDLDVTKNTVLNKLHCYNSNLTALDVTKNTLLTDLTCAYNKLTTLDVTKNTVLTSLYCYENQLTVLDVSQNAVLGYLNCSYNKLTALNLKNGNNSNMYGQYIDFTNNQYLSCIQVDDKSYSDTYWWPSHKDDWATYSEDCSKLSNEEMLFEKVLLYPNPVDGQLFIDNIALDSITVFSLLGNTIKTFEFDGIAKTNTIDLSELTTGVYLLTLKSKNTVVNRKIAVK